ncbi:hypothetical protein [Amphibiibacter pelophylacis]|uniref:Uncharacterized protein n=1 Tax=Amphibiibacter pelophylacis TaxID=1799477 RepID=A0ACC6NYF1_9BURK
MSTPPPFMLRSATPADAAEIARLSHELGYPVTPEQVSAANRSTSTRGR